MDVFVRTDPWSVSVLRRQRRIPDPGRSPWCWTQHGPAQPVFKHPLGFQQHFPAEIAAHTEVGAPADTGMALALLLSPADPLRLLGLIQSWMQFLNTILHPKPTGKTFCKIFLVFLAFGVPQNTALPSHGIMQISSRVE